MKKLSSLLGQLLSSTLFALAMVGLILPPNVIAQPGAKPAILTSGLGAEGHLQIEVLKMSSAAELPELFQLRVNDRTLRFEKDGDGYWAYDLERPEKHTFQRVPDLHDVLRWQVERDDSGSFHARVPFDQVAEKTPDDWKVEQPEGASTEPKLDLYGYFDTEAKTMRVASVLPQGSLVDVSVSFTAIDDATLGLNAQGTGEKWLIIVPLATILIILGVVVISCGLLIISQGLICDSVCPNGVQSSSASCVPPSVSCNCQPLGGGGGHCKSTVQTVKAIGLDDGGSLRDLPVKGIQLTRLESSGMEHHGQVMRYLMAEWALVSLDPAKSGGGGGRILAASSNVFSESSLADLAIGEKASALGTALLVAVPPHDDNSRLISLPELKLSAPISSAIAGQVLVQVDFSEDRRLQGLTVLHDNLGGVSAELFNQLRGSLSMSYASDDQHRAVSFALISVGSESRLETVVTYLPKCCCGGVPCV